MFTLLVTLVFLFNSALSSNYCCCCDITNFHEITKNWTLSNQCKSPQVCCNIPTKEECELQLNPTYDGSCGHANEASNQKKHNGPVAQKIPRDGSYTSELYGWFGQRLMDELGNEIQEWCFDNGDQDSFYLWRYVKCDGSYPNWFARCVWPSATNSLIYKSCNSDKFSTTLPSCFGQIEEMNIGLGDYYGHDIDYRYNTSDEFLWIWCTDYNKPKNPTDNIVYDGLAPSNGDGIVPFYYNKCRFLVKPIQNKETKNYMASYTKSTINKNNINNNNNNNNIMLPLKFRVGIDVNKIDNCTYEFILHGNNMPKHYEAIIQFGDNLSLGIPYFMNIKNINNNNNNKWDINISEVQNHGNLITFSYNDINNNVMLNNETMYNFIITFSSNSNNNDFNQKIGWIAKSSYDNGTFVGYGSLKLN